MRFRNLFIASMLVLSMTLQPVYATDVANMDYEGYLFSSPMFKDLDGNLQPLMFLPDCYGELYPVSTISYGKTVGNDYKYVVGYNNIYISYGKMELEDEIFLAKARASEDDVHVNLYASLEEALSYADLIPSNSLINISVSSEWLGVNSMSDFRDIASDIILYVYDKGDNLVCSTDLTSLSKYLTKGEQAQSKNYGSVAVEVKDPIYNSFGDIVGNQLELRWSLPDNGMASDFYIPNTDACYVLDLSQEGNKLYDFTAPNGVYDWTFTTNQTKFKGTIEITNNGSSSSTQVTIPIQDLDMSTPVITFGEFPEDAYSGFSHDIIMNSNIAVTMNFNGTCDGIFKTNSTFSVRSNGTYHWTAISQAGVMTEGDLVVDFIKEPDRSQAIGQNKDTSVSNLAQTGLLSSLLHNVGVLIFGAGCGVLLGFSTYTLLKKKRNKRGGDDK